MELNINQQYTQTTQQNSFYQIKVNKFEPDEKTAVNYQESRYISFKLNIQVLIKSEINEQNSNFNLSLDQTHSKNLLTKPSLPTTANSSPILFEDSYWGSEQTSARLANFVIIGGGDNLEKIRMGREGIIRGFKEAEKLWGGELPEISYKTLEKALARIDDRIRSFGEPVINLAA